MRRMAAILLFWAFVASSALAQEQKTITLPYDGPDFFCHILFRKGIVPVASYDDALHDPMQTIVIVWGEWRLPPTSKFIQERDEAYRKAGGNLFVATDYPFELPELGVRVVGNPVYAPPDECFGEHAQCPWLSYGEPGAEDGNSPHEHPLFNLLQNKIATNRPSMLRVAKDSPLKHMLVMPRIPKGGFGFGGFKPPPQNYYLAVSPRNAPPMGRTLVMAGHGMFTNGMMLQAQTDNFAFAINAIEWMREGPNGTKRTRALFVVDGEIITNFDRNLTPPLPPIPMPTVEMINRLLRGLEDEGFFHWALRQVLGDAYRNAVPFIFGIGTCIVLLYGAKKFLDGRVSRDTAVPRMVGVPLAKPAEPRVGQRQKAVYRQNDAGAEARLLALNWLAAEFGLEPEQFTSEDALTIRVAGSFWSRGWLQRQVDFVGQLACAAEPIEVSRADFNALVRALPRLSQAHRDGRLTLLLNGKEVT